MDYEVATSDPYSVSFDPYGGVAVPAPPLAKVAIAKFPGPTALQERPAGAAQYNVWGEQANLEGLAAPRTPPNLQCNHDLVIHDVQSSPEIGEHVAVENGAEVGTGDYFAQDLESQAAVGTNGFDDDGAEMINGGSGIMEDINQFEGDTEEFMVEDTVGEELKLSEFVVEDTVTDTQIPAEDTFSSDGDGDEEPRWLAGEIVEDDAAAADAEVCAGILDAADEADDEDMAYPQYIPRLAQYLIGHPGALITRKRKNLAKGKGKRYFGQSKSEDVMADKVVTGCWACGKLDHDSSECSWKRCFVCSGQGHESAECTSKTLWCAKCRSQGHEALDCPADIYTAGVQQDEDPKWCRCLNCKAEGHVNCGELPDEDPQVSKGHWRGKTDICKGNHNFGKSRGKADRKGKGDGGKGDMCDDAGNGAYGGKNSFGGKGGRCSLIPRGAVPCKVPSRCTQYGRMGQPSRLPHGSSPYGGQPNAPWQRVIPPRGGQGDAPWQYDSDDVDASVSLRPRAPTGPPPPKLIPARSPFNAFQHQQHRAPTVSAPQNEDEWEAEIQGPSGHSRNMAPNDDADLDVEWDGDDVRSFQPAPRRPFVVPSRPAPYGASVGSFGSHSNSSRGQAPWNDISSGFGHKGGPAWVGAPTSKAGRMARGGPPTKGGWGGGKNGSSGHWPAQHDGGNRYSGFQRQAR